MFHHNKDLLKLDASSRTCAMAFILLAIIALVATAPMLTKAETGGNPSGASVNIINALNDSVVVHCTSKDSDLGQTAVTANTNYYWSFHPNIFGRTVYNCEFLWAAKRQEFPVWKGSYYDDRPPCCSKGPCSYKVCGNGFYYALTVDSDDGDGPAESWEFFQPWLVNPKLD